MINPYGYGIYQNQPTTPQELQNELDRYRRMYGQAYPQSQGSTGGTYVKVSSYDEVKNIECPFDGRPIMAFDEKNGRLYSKKMVNGDVYITGFRLVPLEEQPKPMPQENDTNTAQLYSPELETAIDRINQRLDELERRLDYGTSGIPSQPAEKDES